MSLLDIRDLAVRYGARPALCGVSLALAPGEVLGVVGESGSGKSTLALAAIGLLPPEARGEGRIAVDGRALADLDERARDRMRGGTIGLVFQEPMTALDPLMTAGAQVAEAIRLHAGGTRREARAKAAETLARCGLDPAEAPPGRYPHQLSGGQRQRVAIAIAIAAGPKLLIADEPTSALDTITQGRIMALLRGLVAERGMGLLLISHDLALVAEHADRILVMHDGRVVETGAARSLLAAPAADYTRRLVAAAAHVPERRPRASGGAPLLAVEHVSRSFGGTQAVVDASFVVRPGESVGIVGPSGAGKTSLLRMVLGLDRPDAGEVRLMGASPARARGPELRRLRRAMQAVFQDPAGSFDPRHAVGRIVAEPLHLLDAAPSPAERRARVARALAEVGLPAAHADRRPHQLSGGERQRVAIARALILGPRLVVLDEPVSALDAAVRAGVLDLLARIMRERGLALLIVGHDLAVMRAMTDRLLVMAAGRIVEEGETRALLAAPAHPSTRALVAAAPRLPIP